MPLVTSLGTTNNAIDVSGLSAFARKYAPQMLKEYVNNAEFTSHFPVETDVVNEKGYMKLTVNNIIKPYTGTLDTAGGEVVYSHRKLKVGVGQSDLAIDPESVRQTPFVNNMLINITQGKKVYDEGVILAEFFNKAMAKLNDTTFYKGDVASSSTDKAILMADGLEKSLLACIASSNPKDQIVPVTTSAFNAGAGWNTVTNEGNIIDAFEAVDDSFTQAYKGMERTIFCSHSVFKGYKTNYKRRHKLDPTFEKFNNGAFGFIYLDDTGYKTKIAPATWLGTSSRLIDVIDGSIRVGTDLAGMASSIDIQKIGYIFYYMMKICFGVEIIDPAGVKVNSLS